MIRGFLTGLVWGGVVAGTGIAVISQVAPLPQPAQTAAATGAASVAATEPAATAKVGAQESAPEPEAAGDAPVADAGEKKLVESPAIVAVAPPEPVAVPTLSDQTVVPPVPQSSDKPGAAPMVAVEPLGAEPAPGSVEPPPAEDSLLDEPLLEMAPRTDAPDAAAVLPGDLPRQIVPDGKALPEVTALMPDPSDLPTIDDTIVKKAEPVIVPEATTPLELFARPFDNPDGKPLFAMLLVDDGLSPQDRDIFAALPFAVTFVLDPLAPGAAEAAAAYRKAGQEVMFQTTAIPAGATASDVEQAMQALDMALPEAVAVLGAGGVAAGSQQMATALVPILADQGRGVVTLARGLNPVDQVARRQGVPHATVFRVLDGQSESVPVIRRYLDRAAFRAAQEGAVVVLGSARPDTIAAILQWTVEGRAASVAIAPVSAVLRADKDE